MSTDIVPLSDLPAKNEWETLCQMAVTLAESRLVPAALYRKPENVLLILLTARDLGIGPTNALSMCYVIDGKVTVAPQLQLAMLNNSGRGTIRPAAGNTAEEATAVVYDSDRATEIGRVTVSRADMPDALLKKSNWKQWPQRMIWARALGFAIRDYFPEAALGVYAADELGAITDEDGNPIDLDTAEPVRGIGREHPISDGTLGELNRIMELIASDETVKNAAAEKWVQKFEKQPRRTFTETQGKDAIALMSPYADQVEHADGEPVEPVAEGEAVCLSCGEPPGEGSTYCAEHEPF